MKRVIILAIFISIFGLLGLVFNTRAQSSLQDEISERSQQIEELQRQIQEYQLQIEENGSKARTLSTEISKLNAQINKVQLEIRSLDLSINQADAEVATTQEQILDAQGKLELHKEALAKNLRAIYQVDKENLTHVIFKNARLSDFFNNLKNLEDTQSNLRAAISNITVLKSDLEQKQEDLGVQINDLERLKVFQSIEKQSLDGVKRDKDNLLKDTKGEEARFQSLVKNTQKDIEALRAQITYLQQNGISAEDAVRFGQLAALGAGIRPAFLIAELEQESALGSNVGKCYIVDTTSGATRSITNGKVYTKGIHPTRDLPLFLSITAELGRDPFQTPVSCGSGWGGAMGAAQFIPSTWMGYREAVSRLTGRTPADPWNIEDAFVAAATKLSKDGANSQTRDGEVAASMRYYCGTPNPKSASIRASCLNYANSVQRKAAEIEKNL
ncbi:MAG: lytic murein transglycosylase [Candidatus Paceibacterota bacterium]